MKRKTIKLRRIDYINSWCLQAHYELLTKLGYKVTVI